MLPPMMEQFAQIFAAPHCITLRAQEGILVNYVLPNGNKHHHGLCWQGCATTLVLKV
jgi:hypothetical protein